MKDVVVVDVTDLAHGVADDLVDRDDIFEVFVLRQIRHGNFAAHHHDVTLGVGFAGDPAAAVLAQAGVEDRVGDGVANFIRMAFAHGFGSKNETSEHGMQLGDGDYDGTKKQMISQHIDQS